MPNRTPVFQNILLAGSLSLLLVLGACSNEDGEDAEQQSEATTSGETSSDEATAEPAETTAGAGAEAEAETETAAAQGENDDFEIDKAEWRGDRGELWVKINGNPGDEIRITSASDPDTVLDASTLGGPEAGSLKISISGDVPCTIRAVRTGDGKVLEREVDVKSGESNCPG